MFSFSNGGLPGEVSNKRPLENGFVPKYKPRRVSAIRDFPPGCGRDAVPVNLKSEENGGSENGDVVANTFGSSQMADLIDPEAVGNSEMTVKTEGNVVDTNEMPKPVEDYEIKDSETQNVVRSSGIRNSNIKVECESHEAVNIAVDVDMTESLDALVGNITANANVDEKLLVETGALEIQLPNEVEYQSHEGINNPIEVERAESLDALVGKVTTTTNEGILNDVEELITESKINEADTLNDMKSDSSIKETGTGGQKMLKELDEVDHLALVKQSDMKEAQSGLHDAASVGKELLLGNSQALSSLPGSSTEASIGSKDKYRPRRVSVIRHFPPHCGRNAPLPTEEEKLMVTGENGRLDGIEKVEVAPTSHRECLDGFGDSPVEKESTALNDDGAGRGPLGEMMDVEIRLADFEQQSITQKTEAREAGAMSKAVVDIRIEDTGRLEGKKEITVYSADKKDKGRPATSGFTSVKESHRKVIVNGLMAAQNCPWRKEEAARPPGSLTLKEKKDCGGAYDENMPEITPISMIRAAPDTSDSDSAEPVGKDIVVYSRGKCEEKKPSRSVFSSADEVDRKVVHGLMSASNCPWRKGKTVSSNPDAKASGEKNRKLNSSWQKKAKAVAKKSSPIVKSSKFSSKKLKKFYINDADESPGALMLADDEGYNGDSPTKSPASHKPRDVEVTLPPFGPNNSGHGDARDKVRNTLRLFNAICRKLLQKEEANSTAEDEGKSKKKISRIDLYAAKVIKEKGKEVNTGKQILGEVPGVEVGDEFQYRVELAVVGIHRLYQAGIDSMKLNNGMLVATSIVSSGAYADDLENNDVLIYSGQGGNVVGNSKQKQKPEDQKLEKGNLALKNCIDTRTPVRVIRGWKEKAVDPLDPKHKLVTTYVYDGLYTVTKYWAETGPHGKQVFMFELRRNSGQPELAWKELKRPNKSRFRPGVCIPDISLGKEPFAICAVNTIDDEKPPPFNYTSKMMYPHWHNSVAPAGCNCTGRCSDSKKCRCAARNCGEIPYNRNGALVETKLLVYECGPHCKCPPSCYNRVSQRGIRYQLEVFKTESRGWGVRALTSIPSGSFICEYAGELLEDTEAERRIGNDEYLFDIGQNLSDSSLNPEDQAISAELVEDGGYTIDACQYGNIGRFVNHSCSPNLYAQNVIYDHDDMKMPHIMLFAMENIPPLQELTYHYNYSVDQIRDSSGNIKVKKCYCGTADCTGRMY